MERSLTSHGCARILMGQVGRTAIDREQRHYKFLISAMGRVYTRNE